MSDYKTLYLETGLQTIDLYFYGPQIHISRHDPANLSYIALSPQQPYTYYYYDYLYDIPLSRIYSHTEFNSPLLDAEVKIVVYPDGRVAIEGAANYTHMVPENKPPYTTAQGYFNLTGDESSSQASAKLNFNLPAEIAAEFPFNSSTASILAQYANDLLMLEMNSTVTLPSGVESLYPFNATNGSIAVTYSAGVLSLEAEGNTTLPDYICSQFPFNAADMSVQGSYSPNILNGTITFSVFDSFTFDDVNVDFHGNQTDLTLNGTAHVVFNVPFNGLIIYNETDLIEKIDYLRTGLLGEGGIVWNMTNGILNVTTVDIDYVLNGVGASITVKIDVEGDFLHAFSYLASGGRNEMLLQPALNEAYGSVLAGSFSIKYSHTTAQAHLNMTLSYDLKRLMDYILTPPAGTTPYVMTGFSMSPTLLTGDLVMVEEVPNLDDILADPETGDIIAFYYPYDIRTVVIHRAINKTYANSTLYFTTQGDANNYTDAWLLPENLVIGRAVERTPLLGYLVSYPYLYPPYSYTPYPQNTTQARMSLLKAAYDSIENMTAEVSYSSIDRQLVIQLSQADRLEALVNASVSILPEILPPDTQPEIRAFIESLLNTTYVSADSAIISFAYEGGTADFSLDATIQGDVNAEVNHVKTLYFQLIAAQYDLYNITGPWQFDFLNQTTLDISNFEINANLGETSFEGRIEGLSLLPPVDSLNATHFKLERFFNLTAPQDPWQYEFPGWGQKLQITIEGGSNATHGVAMYRDPLSVPEPDETAAHQMMWDNTTLSSLKDVIFAIKTIDQFDHGWIVGKVIDGETTLPIANASVIAGSETATTQTNGYYIMSNVPSGNQTVTASALGYIAESKQIYQSSGVTTTVNFELNAGGALDGTVTDEATGYPIEDASIILNGHITSTNSEGYYNISDIAPGNYTVSVAATGYMSDSKPVRIDPHITTSANFTLLPAGNLSITTTPISGEVFVNGTSWGNSPKSQVVTIGQYNITFGPVTGYLTPSWQLAVVQQGVDTTVEGVYDPITGTLTITTTPVNAENIQC
jgi:signal peptidase I